MEEVQMDKLLILDKSVFHKIMFSEKAEGRLLKFVNCHHVILPYTLIIECAVSQKGDPPKEFKDPITLTNKLLEVVKRGAYVGKSPARIVEEESSTNTTIESLIDVEQTEIMREGILDEEPNVEAVRKTCEEAFKPITELVEQWSKQYFKTILKKNKEKDFREEVDEVDLAGRLGKWLKVADTMKRDILDKYYDSGSNDMSEERWEWQMLRLSLAWGSELACRRNKSGPSFDSYDISNDIFDIFYVSHLSHASGLITGDKALVQPLAMAAFPDKGIFNSIDNVTYLYCTCK